MKTHLTATEQVTGSEKVFLNKPRTLFQDKNSLFPSY